MVYCKWTKYSEKWARESGVTFDNNRKEYDTPNTIDYYDYFVLYNCIASGTNSPATFMGDEVVYCNNGMIPLTPCLTHIDVKIGGMFLYNDNIWVRTDTYVATCTAYGGCYFGNLGESEEFEDFDKKAEKLSMPRIESVLLQTALPYIKLEKD